MKVLPAPSISRPPTDDLIRQDAIPAHDPPQSWAYEVAELRAVIASSGQIVAELVGADGVGLDMARI